MVLGYVVVVVVVVVVVFCVEVKGNRVSIRQGRCRARDSQTTDKQTQTHAHRKGLG